jgi:O-antigen ligase
VNAESNLFRAARWLTLASAVAVMLSIAASQVLMALALAALLMSGEKLRLPRIWLPLGLFLLGTLISLGLSDDPADGLSQVRKFYVYLMLLLVYSTFRDAVWVRRMALLWAGAAGLAALRSFVQFAAKRQEAAALGRSFYDYYVAERITGFMSHWMTFSAQMMFVLLGLAAFLFFSPAARKRMWLWVLLGGLAAGALVLGFTRSIAFLATPAAAIYLIWAWKPKALAAVPVLAALAFFAAPRSVKERFTSIYQPGRVDSNEFRKVAWTAGAEMVRQHPWFGLGPERVKARFNEFVPKEVPRPLPAGWYGHLHNIYLHYAAERGIPSTLALMWMLFLIVWDLFRGTRRLPAGRSDVKFALHFGVAMAIAILVEGFFELNLGDSEVLAMFLAATAGGYAALDSAKAGEREAASA